MEGLLPGEEVKATVGAAVVALAQADLRRVDAWDVALVAGDWGLLHGALVG